MPQELELLLKAKNLTDEAFKAVEAHVNSLDEAGKQASSGLVRAQKNLDSFGSSATRLGAGLSAAVTLPIIGIGAASLKAAADAVESENLFAESFEGMAGAARSWSEEVGAAVGSNEFELRRNAATLFTMSKSMGLAQDEAFGMSTSLTELAGDMASFYNLPHEQAFSKIQAGLTGEAEPLKRLGILLDANTIKTVAYEAGIARQGERLTEVQKVQARYLAIMQQTSDAQGDLARTLDSPTNQMRIMQEQLSQLAIEFGTALLPVAQDVLTMLRDDLLPILKAAVEWFTNLEPSTQRWAVVLVGLAAALGPVLVVVGQLAAGAAGMGALLPLFAAAGPAVAGATAALVPFAAVVGAIAGGAALGIWLRDNSELFRSFTNTVGDAAAGVWEFFTQAEKGTDVTETWTEAQKQSLEQFKAMQRELANTAAAAKDTTDAFGDMHDKVIGNSYVPDMVDGIEHHFGRLEDVMLAPVRGVLGDIQSEFQNLGDWVGGFWGDLLGGLSGMLTGWAGGIVTELAGIAAGWISGLFEDEEVEVNDIRDRFFSQFEDGFIGLQRLLVGTIGAVEQEDYVKKIFDAETVEEFEAAVKLVEDLLKDLGKPINIPVNVSYGNTGAPPSATPGYPAAAHGAVVLPFRPRQAAAGAVIQARPGGELVNMGEGGKAELAVPVDALLSRMSETAVRAAAGGGQGPIQVFIGGEKLDEYIVRRNKAGLIPTHEGSTRRY